MEEKIFDIDNCDLEEEPLVYQRGKIEFSIKMVDLDCCRVESSIAIKDYSDSDELRLKDYEERKKKGNFHFKKNPSSLVFVINFWVKEKLNVSIMNSFFDYCEKVLRVAVDELNLK